MQANINGKPSIERLIRRVERIDLALAKPSITEDRKAALNEERARKVSALNEYKSQLESFSG